MRKYLSLFAILIMLVILQQNGVFWRPPPSAEALQGFVDVKGGEPLPDKIYVVATWLSPTGMSGSYCAHLEVTTTDVNGKWSFPMWKGWRHKRRAGLLIEVYSPGFLAVPESSIQDVWLLSKHAGSRYDYLDYLGRLRVDCSQVDGSIANAIPVWEEILRDIIHLKNSAKPLSVADARQFESISSRYAKKIVDPTFDLPSKTRYERARKLIRNIEDSRTRGISDTQQLPGAIGNAHDV